MVVQPGAFTALEDDVRAGSDEHQRIGIGSVVLHRQISMGWGGKCKGGMLPNCAGFGRQEADIPGQPSRARAEALATANNR
ncbi:hypothetical protein D3C86_1731260 [compost metagenome]